MLHKMEKEKQIALLRQRRKSIKERKKRKVWNWRLQGTELLHRCERNLAGRIRRSDRGPV